MNKKKRPLALENITLSNPQRMAVAQLLAGQKNKYKKLLHEAHERVHVIGDMVASVEIWINANGVVEYVSPSMLRTFGHTAKDVLDKAVSFVHLCHPDDLARLRRDLSASLEGEILEQAEYRFLHKNRSPMRVIASWNPVRTRRDRIIGARLSLLDISGPDLCNASRVAFESLLLQQSHDRTDLAICAIALDGPIKYWNAGAIAAFGWSEQEVFGRRFQELLQTDDAERLSSIVQSLASTPTSFDTAIRCKDASLRGAAITLHAAFSLDGIVDDVVCILQPA